MYQRVIIVGNVGRDAEMRYTPSGVPVTSFSVAVNRRWNSATGEQQEKTTWFRVTCWRKLAETAGQYVKKGQRILVEGEVEAQAYIDREGMARGTLELTASNFKFLSSRAETAEGPSAGAVVGEEEFPIHEDEIPF
ncbi:MAG: single-stranded DNA-binding protein [Anaerolineae bacterium]